MKATGGFPGIEGAADKLATAYSREGSMLPRAADERIPGFQPLPWELLPRPIVFKDCPGVRFIEWRPTPSHPETGISAASLRVVGDTCALTLSHFDAYARQAGFPQHNDAPFDWSLSLLPLDNKYRDMFDIEYRFANNGLRAYSPGERPAPPGFTAPGFRQSYLTNEVLLPSGEPNPEFKRILAHELTHALAAHHGIDRLISRGKEDPWLANELFVLPFTDSLGLPEPPEDAGVPAGAAP